MMCFGNAENGMHMHSSRSSSVHKYNFYVDAHMFLLIVMMMLFHIILEVVKSPILVVSSPG